MHKAILMIKNNGTRKPHGQSMGADGSGIFAHVFANNGEVMAEKKAHDYWKEMEALQEYRGHIEFLGITTRIIYNLN